MSTTPTWRYTLAETTLDAADAESVRATVEGGWLSMGPKTQAFEARFAEMHQAKHAIAVSNGTAALHIALLAAGVGPGDEVIQPSLTFVASANMTLAVGAVPVFADIVSLTNPTIDAEHVESLISPRTKAIIAMHFGGYPCEIEALRDIAHNHGLVLIEDACHAPRQTAGAHARYLGTFGAIGTFSFFANKNMTTGEGGMVLTDGDDLAARLRHLRSHGMTTLTWDRHRGRASTYDVVSPGYNYRLDDLRAALGLSQLEKLDAANERRRAVAVAYARLFAETPLAGANFVFAERAGAGTGHVAALIVDAEIRDALRDALKDAGIQTSLHYPPIHEFTAFAAGAHPPLPLTEAFARQVISLPIHPLLGEDDVRNIVAEIVRCGDACRARAGREAGEAA